ncbi:hypothetical protein [Hoeflea sp.]|uniref:hypothetical protein n=1 Tax=Hoeflea sp. TaxID=1940281 RepID=UPI003A8E0729
MQIIGDGQCGVGQANHSKPEWPILDAAIRMTPVEEVHAYPAGKAGHHRRTVNRSEIQQILINGAHQRRQHADTFCWCSCAGAVSLPFRSKPAGVAVSGRRRSTACLIRHQCPMVLRQPLNAEIFGYADTLRVITRDVQNQW